MLYGHPGSGTFWGKHVHKKLPETGFEPAAEAWPSCYLHPETDLFLVLSVDDVLMSGPEHNLKPMWEKIASILNIDEPQPIALYLGCIHEEGSVQIDGKTIRTMTFNQGPFFLDKVEKY